MGRHPDPNRRTATLNAVVEYITKHGLADLSLRPLAQALGTSPRMLLYDFETKEQLVVEALEAIRVREERLFAAWLKEQSRLELPDFWQQAWEWMSAPPQQPFLRLFFEVYGLALQDPQRFRPFLDHVVADWVGWFAERLRPSLGRHDAEVAATSIVAIVRGLLLDLLTTGDRPRVHAAFAQLESSLRHRLVTST